MTSCKIHKHFFVGINGSIKGLFGAPGNKKCLFAHINVSSAVLLLSLFGGLRGGSYLIYLNVHRAWGFWVRMGHETVWYPQGKSWREAKAGLLEVLEGGIEV